MIKSVLRGKGVDEGASYPPSFIFKFVLVGIVTWFF